MTSAGNHELAPEELLKLLGGELPSTLPLEGWRKMTLHCQVDAIGPSTRHPDLVQLEVSFPPVKPPTPPRAQPCRRCRGRGVVPDYREWDQHHGEPRPVPCPDCRPTEASDSLCTATALHALGGVTFCAEPAGHYDESRWPDRMVENDPGGWHRSAPFFPNGDRVVWNDKADAAVPHGCVRSTCPTCGPTALEEHPRTPGILRCRNCKEHLARSQAGETQEG